ncbi:hypothetical protein GS446_25685 [Rhodococcus hoagii]|nr:hypothetical protein [Prescottella equi]
MITSTVRRLAVIDSESLTAVVREHATLVGLGGVTYLRDGAEQKAEVTFRGGHPIVTTTLTTPPR